MIFLPSDLRNRQKDEGQTMSAKHTSVERYNPITGTGIPATPARTNTSAIFGGSPGSIEYMFIPPSATTRPTKPSASSEKRRSLSRESLRRSFPPVSESHPDSDEESSSVSDLSECGGEADQRSPRSYHANCKARKPLSRSASSRLPVSAPKPRVMKRAHSFTRENPACSSRGVGDPQATHSVSDLTNQQKRSGSTSKIPVKPTTGSRNIGLQSSRIPMKRADVNSNTEKGPGNENTVVKRTATSKDSRISGTSSKSTSLHKRTTQHKESSASEATVAKNGTASGIPVKSSVSNNQSSLSKIPQPKQDVCQVGASNKANEKTGGRKGSTNKENDDIKTSLHGGKQPLKRGGTGDELRTSKSETSKSEVPRKSNIPGGNTSKGVPQKNKSSGKLGGEEVGIRNKQDTEGSLPDSAGSNPRQHGSSKIPVNKRAEPKIAGCPAASPPRALQRSDSGYGDTDSVSSKEDTPVETGNEFSLSRENSKSKIPVMSKRSRSATKAAGDVSSANEATKTADITKKKNEKLKSEPGSSDDRVSLKAPNSEAKFLNVCNDLTVPESNKEGKAGVASVKSQDGTSMDVTQRSQTGESAVLLFSGKNKPDESTISRPAVRQGASEEEVTSREHLSRGLQDPEMVTAIKRPPAPEKTRVLQRHGDLVRGKDQNGEETKARCADGLGAHGGDQNGGSLVADYRNVSKDEKISSSDGQKVLAGAGGKDWKEHRKTSTGTEKRSSFKQPGDQSSDVIPGGVEISEDANVKTAKASTNANQKPVKSSYVERGLKNTGLGDNDNTECGTKDFEKEKDDDVPGKSGYMSKESLQSSYLEKRLGSEGPKNNDKSECDVIKKKKQDDTTGKGRDMAKEILQLNNSGKSFENVGSENARKQQPDRKYMDSEKQQGLLKEERYSDKDAPQLSGLVEGFDEARGKEEVVRRPDVCFECRVEKSANEEDGGEADDDIRRYPTFISPRKSLVFCKHHQKLKDHVGASDDGEKPLAPMTSLTGVNNGNNSEVGVENAWKVAINDENKQECQKPIQRNERTNTREDDSNVLKGKVAAPAIDQITPKKKPDPPRRISKSNSIKDESRAGKFGQRQNAENNIHEGPGAKDTRSDAMPKGSHSPLLALSRDKKFVSGENIVPSKNTEESKSALSLEWDDIGTELSPPNFSEEDEESLETASMIRGKNEEDRRPGMKLMNTNEALDKLKVIQSLIMKEAKNRSRRESEENAGNHSIGVKKPGDEVSKTSGNYGMYVGSMQEKARPDDFQISTKKDSVSNQVSPTTETSKRKASSPTIWDRISDKTISQDQTTELLNETLAKLKASPQLNSNAFTRRTISSRSLPGSRQASKEQLLSDSERPVYVYTSSWMNTSGKNSRGSSLSLCSANRSLPSSRQNLSKDPSAALKRSESASGRMEKDGGKIPEGKVKKEFRLSDFDEVTLSDDGTQELKNHKCGNPTVSPVAEKPVMQHEGDKKPRKLSKRKKKSKNTAATMNNLPPYGVSMEELADGKTKCQCGGKSCVIS